MGCRIFCFITDKIFKSLYTLLLIVLMTLWIVISVEAGRQLLEIQQKSHGGNRIRPEDARRLPGSLASAALISASKTSISRMYALTIFNTLLEEVIALGALISLFIKARRLFIVTLVLLVIIWFIEQYRISDFYHQIDHLDYQSGQIIVTTHVLHFLIILIGILLSLGMDFKLSSNTAIEEMVPKASSKFADLERNGSPAESDNQTIMSSGSNGLVKKARCAWMRSTFIKRKDDKPSGKQPQSKSNDVTVIDVEEDEGNFADNAIEVMANK